jgi:hypothetical protein
MTAVPCDRGRSGSAQRTAHVGGNATLAARGRGISYDAERATDRRHYKEVKSRTGGRHLGSRTMRPLHWLARLENLGMTRKTRWAPLIALCALVGGGPAAFAYAGQELASGAQVTIDQARAIALKTVPGQITDEELGRKKVAAASDIPSTLNTETTPTRSESMPAPVRCWRRSLRGSNPFSGGHRPRHCVTNAPGPPLAREVLFTGAHGTEPCRFVRFHPTPGKLERGKVGLAVGSARCRL